MGTKIGRGIVAFALAAVMVLATAGAASAASFYDSYWKTNEQHIVYVGSGGGSSEPNDLTVKIRCYGQDSRFEVSIQYRSWWTWWNDENTRLVNCGESTTYWNPTRDGGTDYRVIVQRQTYNPRGISAKATAWWN